jgi:hypothetical protein
MRLISNLPSQFQQEMEFLRPMYEERLAKMKDLSEGDWGDRPVRRYIVFYLLC